MLSVPLWILGLICLVAGLFFTFLAPTGRRATYGYFDELAVFLLFVGAAYCLWPDRQGWVWLLVGVAAGAIAFLIIEYRRFAKYVDNLENRIQHPYFWYGKFRSWSRRRRRD